MEQAIIRALPTLSVHTLLVSIPPVALYLDQEELNVLLKVLDAV
jgi:hypothetical protein